MHGVISWLVRAPRADPCEPPMLALCSAARLQPVGLDEHRLGIEPHRHVEIEPCGDLVTVYPVL